MKACKTCGETKPLDDFHRSKKWADGRRNECKPCRSKREHANRKENTARYLRWVEKNPERRAESRRAFFDRNPDKLTEYSRRYRHGNAYVRQAVEQRRPRKRDELSADYAEVLMHDPCSYCGSTDDPTVDHIDAIHYGGENHWSNYTAACRACNGSKRERPLLTYLLGV